MTTMNEAVSQSSSSFTVATRTRVGTRVDVWLGLLRRTAFLQPWAFWGPFQGAKMGPPSGIREIFGGVNR